MADMLISATAMLAAATGGVQATTSGPVQTIPPQAAAGAEAASADGAASTQSPPVDPQAAEGGVADIVVTAQRRSENLQRVPIAVTAVTGSALKASGVDNISNLAAVVPGIVIQRLYAGVNPYLRGIGSVTTGFTSEQPVATYIDGIYIPNAASGLFAFNNVERIEVLKGPQGTLFGRNAVGGLINVITRDPAQTPHLEGYVSYASYETVEASTYLSGGLAPDLAADVSILYTNQNRGCGRNVVTGSELFDRREFSASTKLVWQPSSDTKITLRALYDDGRSTQGVSYGVFPGSVASDGERYIGKYDVASQYDPYLLTRQANVGFKIEQSLGGVRLVSITGYNYVRSNFQSVSNGIAGKPITGQSAVNLHLYGGSGTVSQELQLLSRVDSRFEWIVGAFYLHDRFRTTNETFPTCINSVCAAQPQATQSVARQKTDSIAGFGELTYHLGDATRVTAGLRYTHDHKDVTGSFREPLPGYGVATPATLAAPNFFGDVGGVAPTASFSKLTWRGVLAHDLSRDVLLYASANRGFKAGAYSSVTFNNPTVRPEVLDAYEVGLKSTLFDRVLRLNLAGFYYDYKDIQLRTFPTNAPGTASILYNAARAHTKGVDADLVLAPTGRLTITGGAEYLDARFTSFPNGPCSSPRAITATVLGGAVTTPCDLGGKRLPRAPKFTGTLGATYRLQTTFGAVSLNVNDADNSGFFWEVDNRLSQSAYHQLSATATWTAPDRKLYVQAFGKNLNNPYYIAGVVEASAGSADEYTPGEPRSYGVKIGFSF